ncbi:MAG: hypothetical protein LBJ67_09380 [Planctomycetaceae bacterium]|jgi:hypothetical protein|nr:hypothetical protein [Planctomycetaceae bacterium]
MFQNRKNIILCSVILILVVFPFVMHWIRKNDSVNNINSIEYFDRRSSREIETSLYEKDLKIKHINAKFSYLPFPQDILIISSLTLSPDGKYIFISGGTVPHQKIYMAPFPPKSEADYRLLCDLPNVYDVIALQCSPFDKNKIGFFVMEECPPDGEKKMIGDGEVRASFYVISTIDKKNGNLVSFAY